MTCSIASDHHAQIASFEDDGGAYDQVDAAGFIKLQALRLRTLTTARGEAPVGANGAKINVNA